MWFRRLLSTLKLIDKFKPTRRNVGLGSLLLVIGCLLSIYYYPLPKQIVNTEYSTVLYSADNHLLAAKIAKDGQWRFPPTANLPDKYVKALLFFEDKRFYHHIGVDPLALLRAIHSNYQHGRIVSGGSTITMQLARMLKGSQARTYWQKFKEILLAFQLEAHFSKDEILALYAAHAPFGGNTVGLSAANWRYFGHDMQKMTWAEAALFAVLPNKPSSLYPGKNRKQLLSKRNRLLDDLHAFGYLDDLDLKLSKLEGLPGKPKPLPNRAGLLLETLIKQHPQTSYFHSTIDNKIQEQTQSIAEHHIRRLGRTYINNLSILVIDNFAGTTLSYIGNETYENNHLYSPAVDIIQRPRSSGSLLKPFLFSMMLQEGLLLPKTLVLDVPSYYNGYSPENYDRAYRGVVTARQALIESLNVPSVRLLKEYGIAAFKKDLLDIGLTTLFRPADEYGLTLILGGAETTLWDITNAYAGLALSAYGRSFQQASLLRDDTTEKIKYPIEQGAAWLTLEALTQVKRPGVESGWKEFSSSQQIAWKTGTSYGWRDAWAVGSNGRYSVGVWTGNANGEEGRELTGSRAAAPVMLDVFRLLSSEKWPEKPYQALQKLTVCKNDNYLKSASCDLEEVFAPKTAYFEKTSPFHQRVLIDSKSQLRVHGGCEMVAKMEAKSYFVLPPVAEYYYQKIYPNYEYLPTWRPDCLDNLPLAANDLPMQLEYPAEGARIKIPVELDNRLGRAIFRAQHRVANASLYWHLDDQYLGETKHIHEKAIYANPGWHQLILVDDRGYQLRRWFKVV